MANFVDKSDGTIAIHISEDYSWKDNVINHFARITQFLTWPFLFPLFYSIFNLKISGDKNFKLVKSPFIIISNHFSYFDSFLFRFALGFLTPHLPLRFMAVNRFNWKFLNFLASIGIISFVYSLFGVFTIVPGRGINKNLERARQIIKIGGNIVIYPEGKINTNNGIGKFKKGAATLAREMKIPVIPVAFRINNNGLFRKEIRITIGEPITISSKMPIVEATTYFHSRVSALYEKNSLK